MPKTATKTLPRYWKVAIGRITGLTYCDRDCGCGENNQMWYWNQSVQPWVPSWMNCVGTEEVWRWLAENGRTE